MTSPARSIGLLGVPTSAGSHNAGQDKAPAALRAAGLAERLAGRGVSVRDFGDLPVTRHRPVPPGRPWSGSVRSGQPG
jgi:arginase